MLKKYWHIWVIGLLTLAWNAIGALDYFMTQSKNETYMAQFSPEQLSFFYGFPLWVNASWAIAVWFSVAGSILILMRSRYAAPVLGISLLAMVATAIHNFLLSDINMQDVVGNEAVYFTAVIFVVALALWIYAWQMVRRGLLS